MKKPGLVLLTFLALSLSTLGQTSAKSTEKYDGVFPVLGYLGGKLVDELKTRFNLEEENDTIPKVETNVELSIGWFKVETKEMRAKKD